MTNDLSNRLLRLPLGMGWSAEQQEMILSYLIVEIKRLGRVLQFALLHLPVQHRSKRCFYKFLTIADKKCHYMDVFCHRPFAKELNQILNTLFFNIISYFFIVSLLVCYLLDDLKVAQSSPQKSD